jgi:hypothetical protein
LTPPQVKDGKGGKKLPLRLKQKKSSFDTPSDKRWQGGHTLPLRLKIKAKKPGFDTLSDKKWQR